MNATGIIRQFMITGTVLVIALIILITGLSISCFTKQQELTAAVKKTGYELNKAHIIDLALYQMDIARMRYRRTGLNLFRLAFEQNADDLATQITQLRLLTIADSTQTTCIESVANGVADLKLYWQTNTPDANVAYNKLHTALQEDTKVDDIREDLAVIEQGFQNQLSAMQQNNLKILRQIRNAIIASAIAAVLIVIVLMITFGRVQNKLTALPNP